jgi:hypothetical protein
MKSLREEEFPVPTRKFPVPHKKFPVLSRTGNWELAYKILKLLTNLPVFGIAQGICRQRVEMTAGIGAEIAKSVENPKNSLLNSLF